MNLENGSFTVISGTGEDLPSCEGGGEGRGASGGEGGEERSDE